MVESSENLLPPLILLHGTSSSSAKDQTEQGNFKSTFRFIYKLQLDIATTMGSGIYHNLEYENENMFVLSSSKGHTFTVQSRQERCHPFKEK